MAEEDARLIELYNTYGNQWTIISQLLKSMCPDACHNRYKKLRKDQARDEMLRARRIADGNAKGAVESGKTGSKPRGRSKTTRCDKFVEKILKETNEYAP